LSLYYPECVPYKTVFICKEAGRYVVKDDPSVSYLLTKVRFHEIEYAKKWVDKKSEEYERRIRRRYERAC